MVGPQTATRRLFQIRMPELKDNFRIANREAVFISDPPPQDESIVVESEVGGIEKQNLPDAGSQLQRVFGRKAYIALVGCAMDDSAVLTEISDTGEAIGFQDQLALEVVNLVERAAVAIHPMAQASRSPGPEGVGCHRARSELLVTSRTIRS